MDTCVFCTIAERNEPHHEIIWSDGEHLAFLSIEPSKEGHTILIPKAHSDGVVDLPKEKYEPLFEAARKVAVLLKARLQCHNVSIVSEGNSVPHTHLHIIPLKKGETLATFVTERKTPDELAEIAGRIR
jgi:histidine triad (HIT) family protein